MTTPDENVEALRRLFELVGGGENPEALYELLDPDIDFVVTEQDLNAGTYRGHEGVRRYFRSWAGTWSEWHFGPQQLYAVGEDQVAVDLHQRARGRRAVSRWRADSASCGPSATAWWCAGRTSRALRRR